MSTLIRPPPADPAKSSIESVLELLQLSDIDPNLFTNKRPLWHPPGARGVYGGAVIAQCLSAAMQTVPNNFTVHSMHCYFVLAGNSEIPIIYHVERVREGKSFCTRTVQARQRGKPIFTTTMSFTRENSGGKELVEHAVEMSDVPQPIEEDDKQRHPQGLEGPFQSQRIDITNHLSQSAHLKKTRQWVKAKGKISDAGGHQAHLSALAYISDSYFIGTVARVHRLWRSATPQNADKSKIKIDEGYTKTIQDVANEGLDVDTTGKKRPEIGMMVSLDHTIYFHSPRDFRADDWLFTEMHSPWAGDGRGLVFQHIYTRQGKLVATCVQEGVVRLRQQQESKL
ncbi:MAG: hypothetical protein M1820_005081 [Bogoriella megaspora]|nr:MAG: hypothetical protein M1820_005081 [Bogoriella megaspora]